MSTSAHSCAHHAPSSASADAADSSSGETAEMVAFFEASIPDAKELQAALANAGIEVEIGKRGGCGTGCGCGSKVMLLAHRDDIPRVAAVFDERWRALVAAEGTLEDEGAPAHTSDAADACPACGTPVTDGASACSDCGLVWG